MLSIMIAGLFALFGYFASQGKRWAFHAGMVLYAVDGLIMLYFADWIGVLFHGFFLWGLFGGLRALGQLQELSSQKQTGFPQNIGVQ
jgi:predicted MFS family arabinose efflux permease